MGTAVECRADDALPAPITMIPPTAESGWSWINSVAITVLGGALSLLVGLLLYYANVKRLAADRIANAHEALLGRVVELEKQGALISQAVVPISAAFQAMLIKELTHYHTPEMDALMVKIGPPFSLTLTEVERLSNLLEKRSRDMDNAISESERDAATMLPLVMKRVLADNQLVGIAAEPLVRMIVVEKPSEE